MRQNTDTDPGEMGDYDDFDQFLEAAKIEWSLVESYLRNYSGAFGQRVPELGGKVHEMGEVSVPKTCSQ